MSRVFTHMTMSLDGFIADPDDGIGELFGWYEQGPVTVPGADGHHFFHVDENSAALLRDIIGSAGALVTGRRLFDLTDGWGDKHPIGAPVFVVTRKVPSDTSRWPNTTFTTGLPDAIAQAKRRAGTKDVVIASAAISGQALDLGLVDEVVVSLVPVLLGAGIPYFAGLTHAPHRFADPVVVQGTRATHLRYPVIRS
jgi:dihydrofolate reductase